jgi:hypothetical protein
MMSPHSAEPRTAGEIEREIVRLWRVLGDRRKEAVVREQAAYEIRKLEDRLEASQESDQ